MYRGRYLRCHSVNMSCIGTSCSRAASFSRAMLAMCSKRARRVSTCLVWAPHWLRGRCSMALGRRAVHRHVLLEQRIGFTSLACDGVRWSLVYFVQRGLRRTKRKRETCRMPTQLPILRATFIFFIGQLFSTLNCEFSCQRFLLSRGLRHYS